MMNILVMNIQKKIFQKNHQKNIHQKYGKQYNYNGCTFVNVSQPISSNVANKPTNTAPKYSEAKPIIKKKKKNTPKIWETNPRYSRMQDIDFENYVGAWGKVLSNFGYATPSKDAVQKQKKGGKKRGKTWY